METSNISVVYMHEREDKLLQLTLYLEGKHEATWQHLCRLTDMQSKGRSC